MERESLSFDVLIIGAGPSGLSAAIRLAQLTLQDSPPLSICVLEKGAQVGSHLLSGAILEPRALNELLPDWRTQGAPLNVPVLEDTLYYLTEKKAFRLPTPSLMKNKGNYIVSIENFCHWLSKQAESLGVTIFSGFAGVEILYDKDKVIGIVTGDKGVDKNNQPLDRFQPGIQLFAKQTIFAEGCRGSLTKQLIQKYALQTNCSPQTYGIGVKELWEIPQEQHRLGKAIHSIGWPLDSKTYGGGFIYHAAHQQLAVGYIIGLDYQNPYLDPFEELQRFKKHPFNINLFKEGRRICYGARAIVEGGWQSLPKLTVPGAMIIGDSAGTLNVPKIKGTHTAMKSGIIAAEILYKNRNQLEGEHKAFESHLKKSWLGEELYLARNIRPSFRKGLWSGLFYSAIDMYLFHGRAPWTFRNHPDYNTLKPSKHIKKINYPKPDNQITFDKLSSVYLSNTHYRENQPGHLQLIDPAVAIDINWKIYDSPESYYCPAAVYEIVILDQKPHLQINASNCIQCKTCDIKDPEQNINWVPPEGGDGPNYIDM
jgi:electron-transferring-flavoprotein dehydrogenase